MLLFINSTIFPFKASILDGRELNTIFDDIIPVLRNLIVLFAFILFTIIQFKKVRYISLPILILLTVYLSINSIYKDVITIKSNYTQEEVLYNASTFSKSKNIVIIVMDSLQGTLAEKTFERNPEFINEFNGFTIFTRSFSSFPHTSYSKPVIQSGKLYSTTSKNNRVNTISSFDDSFISDMIDLDIPIFGLGIDSYNKFPSLIALDSISISPLINYNTSFSASIARVLGFWPLKTFFNIFFNDINDKLDVGAILINTKQKSKDLFDELLLKFNVEGDTDKCLYLWDYTLHTPIAFSREGEIRSLEGITLEDALIDEIVFGYRQLIKLFKLMKQNEVYDNSLILIVSDHGNIYAASSKNTSISEDFINGNKYNGNKFNSIVYNSVLFVKPPKANDIPIITYDSAWNGDVRNIISFYMNNFRNISPIEVVSSIRLKKPYVDILFFDPTAPSSMYETSADHETVSVTSLYDIPYAFTEKSGIVDD
jgi:hypothetical protein